MVNSLGMSRGGSAGRGGNRLAKFAPGKLVKPFMGRALDAVTEPIRFRTTKGSLAHGYEAVVLADICDGVLLAEEAGVLQP